MESIKKHFAIKIKAQNFGKYMKAKNEKIKCSKYELKSTKIT